jgi:hypothetical protein
MIGNFRNAIVLITLTSSNWVKRFASVRANATGSQASSLTRQVGILPAFFSAGWKPAGRDRLGAYLPAPEFNASTLSERLDD